MPFSSKSYMYLLLVQASDVRKERRWSSSVALKHGKDAGEAVEKDTDVAEVVIAATLLNAQGKSRRAWVAG